MKTAKEFLEAYNKIQEQKRVEEEYKKTDEYQLKYVEEQLRKFVDKLPYAQVGIKLNTTVVEKLKELGYRVFEQKGHNYIHVKGNVEEYTWYQCLILYGEEDDILDTDLQFMEEL